MHKKEKITLGFSPCPNDTFIFDALVNRKIDIGDFEFQVILDDVETLNKWATEGKLDVTKMSFAAGCTLQHTYQLLHSGAALGFGVGPLLIANKPYSLNEISKANLSVALPGRLTTAHFLYNYFAKINAEKIFLPFHEIENWVLDGDESTIRLGVIIHENRFTYAQKGLYCLQDLGAYWEAQTQLPIPLGGIYAHHRLNAQIIFALNRLIRESVQYAFANYKNSLPPFVTENAQEMSEEVMWQHIKLYVNEESITLSEKAQLAINKLSSMLR
jgi:1,4-dihydroxy-6-naphthoate synthase